MIVTVDGCDYTVLTDYDHDVIVVRNSNGQKIADAERDHAIEEVIVSYYDDDGLMDDFGCSVRDLFDQPVAEIATWLVSTHPSN